ncbi:hypothetical protein NPIL_589701 [Nephila pilipes]|uniref:Uncharacterized protein n=1 Tax=Nephila pilipes TaxID=299642 RepID=A0A8X6P0W8_NEPPI|nr:hypothetical protein NPIL_589701 [Nephila pilipes]
MWVPLEFLFSHARDGESKSDKFCGLDIDQTQYPRKTRTQTGESNSESPWCFRSQTGVDAKVFQKFFEYTVSLVHKRIMVSTQWGAAFFPTNRLVNP